MNTQGPILVLGGTGKTGSRIAERLQARDVPVRIGSRTSERPFDWEDRATWGPALEGASAAYISYYPDVALPRAPEAVGAFTEQALASGVRRLVLLSGRGEEMAQRAEAVVEASDADWTIVRCSWFNQNFSEGVFVDQLIAGEVTLPAGDVGEPFVDAEDIADVAVAALTEDGHTGRLYELTGPRLLTFAEAVGEIGKAAGREVRYKQISTDEFESMLTEHELPPDLVWLLRYLFSEVLDGRNAKLEDGVQQALGREPRDFADFAREGAASGVWNA